VPELEILPWRRTQGLAIQVYPSPSRPHDLKRERLEGSVYVRLGSINRRADRELVEELGRFARGEAFDERPMPELGSEALDFRAASESFAPARKLSRADLETLRLVTVHEGRKVPTVVDGTDQAILDTLAGSDGRITSEVAKAIGLTPPATRTRLARLVERGLVRDVGTGPQGPRRRHFAAE